MPTEDEPPTKSGDAPVDEGRILRPEARVLGDEALIPPSNFVDPPPARFTHELVADEPYWYDDRQRGERPNGTLAAGTPVAILREAPDRLRVADGRGLAVDVPPSSVRPLKGGRHTL